MKRFGMFVLGLTACAMAEIAFAAPINLAIDIDTTRTSGTATAGTITTQPGFTSWDTTNVIGAGGTTISEQGVTFELFGIGNNASRIRPTGGGGSENSLLTDFVFNEGAGGRAVGLRISGLPIGVYQMQSWHYDGDPGVAANENFIQVEVRNQGDATATLLVDKFPFGSAATSFQFDVTSVGQVREIIFREDDVANPNGDNADQNRARLNGFTLQSVPEPTSLALLGVAALAGASVRRR